MKIVRKAAAFFMALCILSAAVLFSSCGDGEKNTVEELVEQVAAYTLTSKAVNATRALDSFDAMLNVRIETSLVGAEVAVPFETNVKAAGLKGSSPVYYTGNSLSESYYEGDWCYTVKAGYGTKKQVKGGGAVCEAVQTIDAIQQVLPAMLLVDVTITEEDGGVKTVSVPIPDETFEEIFNEFVSEMSVEAVNDALEGTGKITSYRAYNATARIAVSKDGYVQSYALNFDLDINASITFLVLSTSMSFTSNVDAVLTYSDPGTPVTITFPEGYKDFQEVK